MRREVVDRIRSELEATGLGDEDVRSAVANGHRRALVTSVEEIVKHGFDEKTAIRGLVVALSRGEKHWTIGALNYLCLTLPYDDLPPGLRECQDDEGDAGRKRKKNKAESSGGGSSIEVIAPQQKHEREDNTIEEDVLCCGEDGDDDDDDEECKAFALRFVERMEEEEEETKLSSGEEEDDDEGLSKLMEEDREATAQEVALVEKFCSVQRPAAKAQRAMTWSGATPRQKLEKWCRERGYPRPSYEVASKFEVRCRVWAAKARTKSGPATIETLGSFVGLENWAQCKACHGGNIGAARDMAATIAMYGLAPELPLYRVLPPPFRDYWLERLENDRKETKKKPHRSKVDLEAKCDALVAAILELIPEDRTRTTNENAPPTVVAAESWEDLAMLADDKETAPTEDTDLPSTPTIRENEDDEDARTPPSSRKARRRRRAPVSERRDSAVYEFRRQLPAFECRRAFLDACASSAEVVVCGETGSGKTTQLPQFLYEEAIENGEECRIVVTQPRRVAAASVAARVAEELGEKEVGGIVGLRMRAERRVSKHTSILFCTTGLLLRALNNEDDFISNATHVVLDEIHERAAESDLALAALRRRPPSRNLVLMSATLDASLFQGYLQQAHPSIPVPLVEISGRSYGVAQYYLEDFAQLEPPPPPTQAPHHHRALVEPSLERIENELIRDAVDSVVRGDLLANDNCRLQAPATILVFLPGVAEIRKAADFLGGSAAGYEVCTLHANSSSEEQRFAFQAANGWKVVLSTNVAESSVTIPGVVAVVDACRVKEVRHRNDREVTCPTLALAWCSKASSKQRAGRAGRTCPGLCVRLVPRQFFLAELPEHSKPELQRVPLDELLLNLKQLAIFESAKAWLDQCPEPPPTHAVKSAIVELVGVGALQLPAALATGPGDAFAEDDVDFSLTTLGAHLARLPVHPRLGKMLVVGALFGCSRPVASIAAAAAVSAPVFADPPTLSQQRARKELTPMRADLVAGGRALDAYLRDGRRSIDKFGLRKSSIRDAVDLRDRFLGILQDDGLLDDDDCDRRESDDVRAVASAERTVDSNVLSAVLVAALSPNLARRRGDGWFEVRDDKKQRERAALDSTCLYRDHEGDRLEDEYLAFFSRRFQRGRLLLSGLALATPTALLLFCSGELVVHHAKRKAQIDNFVKLNDIAPSAALLIRALHPRIFKALEEFLLSNQGGEDSMSEEAKNTVDLAKRVLSADLVRAVYNE